MSKQVEVTISPEGDIIVQARGFTGTACKDATKDLEKALGIVKDDIPTTEMYKQFHKPANND